MSPFTISMIEYNYNTSIQIKNENASLNVIIRFCQMLSTEFDRCICASLAGAQLWNSCIACNMKLDSSRFRGVVGFRYSPFSELNSNFERERRAVRQHQYINIYTSSVCHTMRNMPVEDCLHWKNDKIVQQQ